MAVPKSPFTIVRDFLSPLLCEQFCDKIGFTEPDVDAKTNKPLRMLKFDDDIQTIIYSKLINLMPAIEKYYDFEYRGTERMMVKWYTEGVIPITSCENSTYLKKKWIRSRDRDFTGIVFLSDYQENENFDSDYEVYGGKLEFPQHKFGVNPERGTLILFPSVPHFINATANIHAGELYQVRFHIAAKEPYLYNPENFPGDYRSWFAGL